MILTKEAVRLMENQLKDNPLGEGEIRRVEGLGGLYVTEHRLEEDITQDEEVKINGMVYWFQYALSINGSKYYFYAGERVLSDEDD